MRRFCKLAVDCFKVKRVTVQVAAPVLEKCRFHHLRFSMGGGYSYVVPPFVGMQLEKAPVLPGIPDDKGLDVSDFQYSTL